MSLGLLLAILFTLGWVPLYFSRTEAIGQAFQQYDLVEKLSTLSTIVVVSLHMGLGCLVLSFEAEIPAARALVAAVVYVAGIAFWFWGRSLIGPFTVRRGPDEPPLEFKRDGAFGIVRHPLYFGCLTAAAAPVVATLSPWLAASYAVCAGLIALRAVQEERRLRAQLGAQYDAYCKEVKRLVPFLW